MILFITGDETLHAGRVGNGTWVYRNAEKPADAGDIVDFEAQRDFKTRANARETLRPELKKVEQGRRLDRPTAPGAAPTARDKEKPAPNTAVNPYRRNPGKEPGSRDI